MDPVFIIAEAGVNHNGSLPTAKQLVEEAASAGADAVKFQTFKAKNLVTETSPKAAYQLDTTEEQESQHEMIKRLEIDEKGHIALMAHCDLHKIKFLSSPFDLTSIDMLVKLGMDTFKIPSGEITNLPYLRKIGRIGKSIILSTGMSYLQEVKNAVKILIDAGANTESIALLHCNTEYPTPMADVNLNVMTTIKKAFPGTRIGYSDHTPGIEVAVAAVALGAQIIEKHFTLDRNMAGPDHRASLEPGELKQMINAIRNIEFAMGDGIKKPSASEQPNIAIARKSIVAAVDIEENEIFTDKNLTVKRPGTGISPMEWDLMIGKRAKRSFKADELIDGF